MTDHHTWILDLMELIIESNIWNLNIPPIFITKSLDSNSKERWFSTRIIATNQNDTNKLYQQKIKINNSLWEEIIKASWNANLCLKVKSKEYFYDFILKKIEKPSWGMMTHPRSWASFLIYTEIIQKLPFWLSDLNRSLQFETFK